MPELSTLPDGVKVFVDTNIFHFHLQGKSMSCTNFITRIAQRKIEAFVNTEVLSDLLHKLMLTEASSKGLTKDMKVPPLKEYLQKHRGQTISLKDYQAQFEAIIKIGLHVLPINKRLLIDTKFERSAYNLMTNDSLHLGCMNRCLVKRMPTPLQDIVTYDGDFEHITGVTVWKPDDIVP